MLLPFADQYIAWDWAGDRILASAAAEEELHEKLRAAGVETSRVVVDFIDDGSVSNVQ